jgi:folate-binding protein YgfZ
MSGQLSCATLPDRALVAVSGPDWRRFLQGLVSQDVESLRPGELRFGAMLTPQGKLLFDLFLLGGGGGCTLDVQATQRDELIGRLGVYRLRAKVQITALDGPVIAAWGGDGWPAGFSTDPRLAGLGWRSLGGACPDGARLADAEDYHAHRLELGIPDPGRDCVPDRTYPIEANFDLLHGIDFKKGCFVGQETTSRMKRRGQIKTRMLPIVFDGEEPPRGSEILTSADLRAGEVLSGMEGRAMALMRLDRIDGPLHVVGSGAVRPIFPEWMAAS